MTQGYHDPHSPKTIFGLSREPLVTIALITIARATDRRVVENRWVV
jgi:hypothetical protein